MLSNLALIFASNYVCESESRNVHGVIGDGKHSSAAHFHFRGRQFELMLEPRQEFVKHPAWNLLALRRIDEPEIQQMDQQNLPVLFHRTEHLLPVDLLMFHQYEVRNIGPIVAITVLNKNLRPDQMGDRWDL